MAVVTWEMVRDAFAVTDSQTDPYVAREKLSKELEPLFNMGGGGGGAVDQVAASLPITVAPTSGVGVVTVGHAVSGVLAGSYGDDTHFPVVTVDATGHVSAVSVRALPLAGSAAPLALGVASPGSSTAYAREDHVHPMPTAVQVGAEPALGNPSSSGQVLSSSTGGVRTWIDRFPLSATGLNQIVVGDGAGGITSYGNLTIYHSGSNVQDLRIGGTTVGYISTYSTGTYVGGFQMYLDGALQYRLISDIGGFHLEAANIDVPLDIAPGASGAVTIAGSGSRPVVVGGIGSGVVRSSGGTLSASALLASEIPTLNQNTTGSAAKWTTPRTLTIGATGKAVDGSANVSWSLAEIGAQPAGSYLTPSNVSGTAGQVAVFSGTNTVASDAGLTRAQSGGKTYQVVIGDGTAASPSSLILKNPTANASMFEIWEGANRRFQMGRSGTNFAMSAYTTGGVGVDDPFKIALASGGEIKLGGSTSRPINLSSGSRLQINGTDAITSARAGNLTALTVGSSTGFVRSTAGVYSASALSAGDIPATINSNTTGSAATLTTPRTLTIGNTGKTFNGSSNVSWSLAEIGAAPAVGGGYLPLVAGPSSPLTGTLHGTSLNFSGWTADAPIAVSMAYSNAYAHAMTVNNSGLTAGQRLTVDFGAASSTNNQANFGFAYAGVGSTANKITLGLYGNNDLVTIAGTGVMTVRDLGTGFVRASSGTLSASALLASEIPNLDASKITSGTLPDARIASAATWNAKLSTVTADATSRAANTFYAAPNGSAGAATFRAIVAADIPTLNQSTTGSAAKWTTPRTVSATGDASWSVSLDGSANVSAALTLASIITAGGPVGSASRVPVFSYDAKGRLTSISDAAITPAAIGALASGGTAVNSSALGGVALDYFVRGNGAGDYGHRTTTIELTPPDNLLPSGFYDGRTSMPSGAYWTHMIRSAHSDPTNAKARWSFDIAANFSGSVGNGENYFVRTNTDIGWGTWRTLWHSGNLTSATLPGGPYLPLAGGTLNSGAQIATNKDITPSTSSNTNYAQAPIVAQRSSNSGTTTVAAVGFHNLGVNAAALYYDAATSVFRYNRHTGNIVTIWDASNLTNLNQLTNGPGYVTNATVANIDVTEHSANNLNFPVVWDNNGRSLYHTAAKMWFNPSSGLFAAVAIASGSTLSASGTLSWGGAGAIPSSDYVVQGNGTGALGHRTTKIIGATATLTQSGFYDLETPADGPQGASWTHMIRNTHSGGATTNQWMFDIAASFGPGVGQPEGYYVRTISAGSTPGWRQLYHSGSTSIVADPAHMGKWVDATYARFGHSSFNTNTGFGYIQHNDGIVHLDAPAIYLRNYGTYVATASGHTFYVNGVFRPERTRELGVADNTHTYLTTETADLRVTSGATYHLPASPAPYQRIKILNNSGAYTIDPNGVIVHGYGFSRNSPFVIPIYGVVELIFNSLLGWWCITGDISPLSTFDVREASFGSGESGAESSNIIPTGYSRVAVTSPGTTILPAPYAGKLLIVQRNSTAPANFYVKPDSGHTVSYIDLSGVARILTNSAANGLNLGANNGCLVFIGASSTAWSLVGAAPVAT